MNNSAVSIIFPVYNGSNVPNIINKHINYLQKKYKNLEIIVIIDKATKTEINNIKREIKDSIVVSNDKRLGKGNAIKQGFRIAKNDIIGFVDVDEHIQNSDVLKIIEKIEKNRVAIGVRKLEQYNSLIRKYLSKFFNLYVKILLSLDIDDTQCGVKFFRKDKIQYILEKSKINGFAIDAEILYLLKKNNEKIVQVPIKWKNGSKSTVSFLSIVEMAINVLRIKIRK